MANETATTGRRLTLSSIVILGSLAGLPPLAIDLYLPALPSLTRDLHTGASNGQLTLTGFVAGLAAGQLVAGALSDTHGRRTPLLVGLGAYVGASALCAVAPSIAVLIVLRVIEGAMGGAGVVIGRAIVRDSHSGAAAARIFALLLLVTGAAPVVGPLIGGQLLRVTDWRGLFAALAALGAVQFMAVAALLGETLPPAARHRGGLRLTLGRFGGLLRDRRFVADAGSLNLGFGALFAFISASSFLLEDVYRTSPQVFSYVFALLSVILVGGAQAGGRMVARIPARRLFSVGVHAIALGSAGALVTVIVGGGLAALVGSLVLVFAGNGLTFPNGTAVSMAGRGEVAGSVSALLGVGQFGLAAIVAPLVGVAGSHATLPAGLVMAACGVGGWLLYRVGGPAHDHRSAGPTARLRRDAAPPLTGR